MLLVFIVYIPSFRWTVFNYRSYSDSATLKQAKVRKSVDSILRWESIILDPIGPMLALGAFYIFEIMEQGFNLPILFSFIFRLGVAIIIGFAASYLFMWLIKRDLIPQNLMPPIQLVFILLIFAICDEFYQNLDYLQLQYLV